MCRAWGILPHELPERGTPERTFIDAEWQQRLEDAKKKDQPLPGTGGL